jgi:PAS domain S-box-containing protein
LFSDLPIAVQSLDGDGCILQVNKKWEEELGFNYVEVKGRRITDFMHESSLDIYNKAFDKLLKTGSVDNTRLQFITKSNHTIDVLCQACRKCDHEGQEITNCILQNITELIDKERKIISQNLELQILNSTKDKLFSIIAHDLRSPFTSILGFSQLLLEASRKEDSESIKSYAKLLNLSAQKSYSLLNNLLQWAQLQTKKIEPVKSQFKVLPVVQIVAESNEDAMLEKELVMLIDIESSLQVYTDSFMLETIFRNLISNAIKYSFPKQHIKIYAKKIKHKIVFGIIDQGTGISEENIKKILDVRNSFSTKGTANEKGTGLGLSICIEFIRILNGQLEITSECNNGSHFCFYLPEK